MKIKTTLHTHISLVLGHVHQGGQGWHWPTRVANQLVQLVDIGGISSPDPSICDFDSYKKKKIYCLDYKG